MFRGIPTWRQDIYTLVTTPIKKCAQGRLPLHSITHHPTLSTPAGQWVCCSFFCKLSQISFKTQPNLHWQYLPLRIPQKNPLQKEAFKGIMVGVHFALVSSCRRALNSQSLSSSPQGASTMVPQQSTMLFCCTWSRVRLQGCPFICVKDWILQKMEFSQRGKVPNAYEM